ncbi:hypothetical protein EHH44_20275 [Mycolicibacter terrae]|uniref:Tat pathway signal protein n=2 Tax=Mycolicibacter TaxID=1073531 RepID=A0A1A2NK33_MYCSD|nr:MULTISPECIES: hypothetical protein [Mycolicibacter]OBH15443.1 hypothetical protein A5694_09225 [Mycolicibacter sinensis]OBI30002.1 hypothetical protein A5710_02300 [Mycolicibacter sinensis]RRR40504.1 hypothetical protein EHH44_20275 [Mycolicibacter terrae]
MSQVPGPLTAIDRRRVLTGAGMLALLALTAPACGSSPAPPAVDDLEAQRQLAHRDSALAAAAGAALAGPDSQALAAALDQVSAERAEHARALATEIARAAGKPAPAIAETTTVSSAPDGPAPTVSQVINALRSAAEGAGKLAIASSGYRAGLLASIAAACTASYAVALVTQS